MIQKHPKRATRNLVVFEAPVELTDKAKMVAERTMVSTSALCRQAVSQYIHRYETNEPTTGASSY